MKKTITYLVFYFWFFIGVHGQEIQAVKYKTSFGVGFGLDYGGLGGRLNYRPIDQINIFGGLGSNFIDVAYNFGAGYIRTIQKGRVDIFLNAMYGYNSVINFSGSSPIKKTYYGPSIAFGEHIYLKRHPKMFVSAELIVPFRSQQFKDDYNSLRSNPQIKVASPLPFLASAGFHFILSKN